MALKLTFLDSSGGDRWKQEALAAIHGCEAVVVYDPDKCKDSQDATWEIERAVEIGKHITEIRSGSDNTEVIARLRQKYDLSEEFEACFSENITNSFELYQLMIESSERLIQRRQRTNAFFITAIGSLLAIAGLLIKSGAVGPGSIGILYGFAAVGLLLCNSWRNLIENYGKLNKAKFDVILRLERELGAQIYSAEWVSLGKGLRPDKYRSFTSTERNVPTYFGLLIVALIIVSICLQIFG